MGRRPIFNDRPGACRFYNRACSSGSHGKWLHQWVTCWGCQHYTRRCIVLPQQPLQRFFSTILLPLQQCAGSVLVAASQVRRCYTCTYAHAHCPIGSTVCHSHTHYHHCICHRSFAYLAACFFSSTGRLSHGRRTYPGHEHHCTMAYGAALYRKLVYLVGNQHFSCVCV